VSGHFLILAAYPWGKDVWYPLTRRMGGSQNQSDHCGEEKNILPFPAIHPIAIPADVKCFLEDWLVKIQIGFKFWIMIKGRMLWSW
jgi:hypothetical protein